MEKNPNNKTDYEFFPGHSNAAIAEALTRLCEQALRDEQGGYTPTYTMQAVRDAVLGTAQLVERDWAQWKQEDTQPDKEHHTTNTPEENDEIAATYSTTAPPDPPQSNYQKGEWITVEFPDSGRIVHMTKRSPGDAFPDLPSHAPRDHNTIWQTCDSALAATSPEASSFARYGDLNFAAEFAGLDPDADDPCPDLPHDPSDPEDNPDDFPKESQS